jgi:hypothetical protein
MPFVLKGVVQADRKAQTAGLGSRRRRSEACSSASLARTSTSLRVTRRAAEVLVADDDARVPHYNLAPMWPHGTHADDRCCLTMPIMITLDCASYAIPRRSVDLFR